MRKKRQTQKKSEIKQIDIFMFSKSVRKPQPPPLSMSLYACENVENCEGPLTIHKTNTELLQNTKNKSSFDQKRWDNSVKRKIRYELANGSINH